jgi:hypothetical protein
MVQPINYMGMIPQPDLGQNLLSGLQLGASFRKVQEEREATERAAQAKQQFEADLQAAQTEGTQAAWTRMIAKYPQFREAFGDVRKGIGEERVKNEFFQGFEVSNALENNQPEVARQLLTTIVEAKKQTGEPTGIFEQVLGAIDRGDVKAAQSGVNKALSILDPERFEKTVTAKETAVQQPAISRTKLAEAEIKETEAKFAEKLQQLGLDEKTWNVRNLQSQINDRAKRLNIDTQVAQANIAEKMSSINKNLTELPADARKLVNEAVTEAATLQQSSERFLDLANRLEEQGGGFGVATSAKDWFVRVGGFESGMAAVRQEYTRLRNTAAIKSLPPGPATDKDIEMALKGFPKENADARTISQFLRGMAKLQAIDAGLANAKTDWLANNRGSLTRANTGFKAGNVDVAPGESFVDVTKRVVDEVSKKYEPRQAAPTPVPAGGPRVQQPVPGTPLINSLLEKYGAQ